MAVTALLGPFVELNQNPPPSGAPVTTALRAVRATDSRDVIDGGAYRVVGTVKETGTPNLPVMRRVLLCDQLSGRVVRSMWSDPVTGAYAFERIRLGVFYVLSFDHTGAFRAVVADNLVSELIP